MAASSPLLHSIHVPEEQQHLPRAALLPVREEQVVAGDAQGASARRVKGLPEHNILHIGGLDVVSKLHQENFNGPALAFKSLPRLSR